MADECLICGSPIEYLQEDVMMECALCHKKPVEGIAMVPRQPRYCTQVGTGDSDTSESTAFGMLADGFRDLGLRLGEVQEFGDGSDVDELRTWLAVAAVHAVSDPADAREGSKRCGVVLFFGGCVAVCGAFLELAH